MKVILGADAIRQPITGIGRYVMELAKHLPEVQDVQTVKYFTRGNLIDSIANLTKAPKLDTLLRLYKLNPALRRFLLLQKPVIKTFQLLNPVRQRLALRGMDSYLYHGPNFYLPPFSGTSVVTFHDLSIYTFSECHPPERVNFMRSEIEKSLKRAKMIITDSEFNRKEIIDYFSWPADRIVAVPLAAGREYHLRHESEVLPLIREFKLDYKNYALFVGTIEPRKNLNVLLDVYECMSMKERKSMPLVVAGHPGWMSKSIHKRLEIAENQGWLRHLGYVSEAHLPILFNGAKIFLFPSLYEGFGLPILEAMASGTAVISSSAASLPEAGGEAAIYVSPNDTDAWLYNIQELKENKSRTDAMSAAGLKHSENFSWKRTAAETVDVYRIALTA